MRMTWGGLLVAAAAACAAEPGPAPAPGAGGGSPWERSAAEGFAFRGVGQEPGWTVEIAPGRELRAVLDYGERTVVAARPTEAREGARRVFRGTAEGGELWVAIEPGPCADAMSGERMSHAVVLRFEGRELRGCGWELPLDGARRVEGWWRLVELWGGEVLGGPEGAPTLRLEAAEGRAGGSTGCNSYGGPVSIEGDRVRFGTLVMTRRACVDEARNAQEGRFTRALEAAERFEVAEGMLVLLRGEEAVARFEGWEGPG